MRALQILSLLQGYWHFGYIELNWPNSAITERLDNNKASSNKMNQRPTAGNYIYHKKIQPVSPCLHPSPQRRSTFSY